MRKPISDDFYAPNESGQLVRQFQRCLAHELSLPESWFRDAIYAQPDLVMGPCRAAGLTDDQWYAWAREFKVGVGSIDVLLVSSQGRVAIVETKLASNPELRRRVLAQALDYATHLTDALERSMPPIPTESGHEVADADDILESVAQGDMFLIVVSDDIDPRVAKLSRGLIGDHLVRSWDLALIDLALYRPVGVRGSGFVVVPCLRSLILAEPRQVVRVIVEGETPRARIQIERVPAGDYASGSEKWNEERFFQRLEDPDTPSAVRALATRLRDLANRYPNSVTLSWGRGREGSMVLKRQDSGLIEVYASGYLRFRRWLPRTALGESLGATYVQALDELFPRQIDQTYPIVQRSEAVGAVERLYEVVRDHVERAEAESAAPHPASS